MSKHPWWPFYGDEFLLDTQHLGPLEIGVYVLLLNEYYRIGGPLPDGGPTDTPPGYTPGYLYRIARVGNLPEGLDEVDHGYQIIDRILEEFFEHRDGFFFNKRADKEISIRNERYNQRCDASKKAAEVRSTKRTTGRSTERSTVRPPQLQLQEHIKPLDGKSSRGGESTIGKNGNSKHPPSPQFSQSDFDERDLRKLCEAEKEIANKCLAAIGTETISEQQFFTMACEAAGITVERGLKLRKQQQKWPEGKRAN